MRKAAFGLLLFIIASVCFSPAPAAVGASQGSKGFSFIAVSDPGYSAWRRALAEIRDLRNNPDPKFSPAEFIHVVGDLHPPSKIYSDYKDAFAIMKSKSPHRRERTPFSGQMLRHSKTAKTSEALAEFLRFT